MRISTKGRYGTRAMLALAGRHGNGLMRANEIADSQGISLKYLESILSNLKSASLVVSERGKNGGYKLARPPAEISLFDILDRLEDSLGFVRCTDGDKDCEREGSCVTRGVWAELRQATERILRDTSLADLIEREEVRQTTGEQFPCCLRGAEPEFN